MMETKNDSPERVIPNHGGGSEALGTIFGNDDVANLPNSKRGRSLSIENMGSANPRNTKLGMRPFKKGRIDDGTPTSIFVNNVLGGQDPRFLQAGFDTSGNGGGVKGNNSPARPQNQLQKNALFLQDAQQSAMQNPAMLAMQSQLMMGGLNPSMAGLFPQMNPFFGQGAAAAAAAMQPSFLGTSGNAGLVPNLTMGSFDAPNALGMMAGNQDFMTQQLGLAGGMGGRTGESNDDSTASSTMTAIGRQQQQLRLMQQALVGGGSSSMFGMGTSGLAQLQSKMFGRSTLSGRSVDSLAPSSSSSMTPAGISHQALYSRDEAGTEEKDSTDKSRITLYMSCDDDSLSDYQCLVRKQIELFDAKEEDVESNAQGRNKPIVLGQVGIRCRHCSKIPPRHRTRGATYYPAKLHGLYQAAQNMASAHLCKHCQLVPDSLRQELIVLRDRKSSAGGGKQYWADGVRVLGVIESGDILRFKPKEEDKKPRGEGDSDDEEKNENDKEEEEEEEEKEEQEEGKADDKTEKEPTDEEAQLL